MIPHRAIRALAPQTRQCTRFYQSTTRQRAADTPRKGRKERSILISNEISALRQGPPPSTSTPPTTSAGFIDTPSTTSPGRMGENAPAEREGIAAQGVARPASMTEPSEGGVDVLSAQAPGIGEVATKPAAAEPKEAGEAITPAAIDKMNLLRSGEGTATIAGGNFAGAVEDRFHHVISPGMRAGVDMTKEQFAQKRAQGQPVRIRRDDRSGKRLNEEVKEAVVGKLVRGEFDRKGLLGGRVDVREGQKKSKPHSVDEVSRRLLLNGTYLGKDRKKLVDKVKGFLTDEQWKKVPLGAR